MAAVRRTTVKVLHQEQEVGKKILLADLKTCSRSRNLERGKQVHAEAIKYGYISSIYVTNALINMYAKCGSMAYARQVFESLKHPTEVSWNALIMGYADNGEGFTALELFRRMKTDGPIPSSVTLLAAIKACAALAVKDGSSGLVKCRDRGKAVQNVAVANGCNSDIYLQNSLIDMYAKCGSMVDAREVFDCLKHPDVVSWTALILGYADIGEGITALDLFTRMRSIGTSPDSVTFLAALKACTTLSVKEGAGKEVHTLALEDGCNLDIYVQSSLIDMYAKSGNMKDAHQVFNTMKHPDVVSWTVLIVGYADNGEGLTALKLFTRMKNEGPTPDSVTLAGVLKACALLGALEFGRTIHSEIDNRNDFNVLLVNCLVDFYAKCGSLVEARKVFDLHPRMRDTITWNALLAGFSSCGDNESVFELFQAMQDAEFRPNGVTFLCILTCCSHGGLVEKGKECFDAMYTKHGIIPCVEHYNCMVDIFGRANKISDAMILLERMRCSPNEVTWMTILSACRRWKNVEIGNVAFQSMIKLNDRDAASYILMGHIYETRGMFQEREMVMGMRKKLRAWKTPEESCWTNEVGEVYTFSVDGSRHSQIHDIRKKWESMTVVMKQHGYIANLTPDVEKEVVCGHSERLAIACALMNTQSGMTIRIVKNQRVCDYCHSAAAFISKLENRTIICRDASRIHVFRDGKCSCGTSW